MREAKAVTSLEETEGEGSRGPEASPEEGGMRAREGGQGMHEAACKIIFKRQCCQCHSLLLSTDAYIICKVPVGILFVKH